MKNMDSLRNQIYSNMQLKTTEELRSIVTQNDHEEWSDAAFEVVRQILFQRTGELPVTPVVSARMPTDWERINWQTVYDNSTRIIKKSKSFLIIVACVYLLFSLGLGIFSFLIVKATGFTFFLFCILFGLGSSGFLYWSYVRMQNSPRIVAKVRVYLKHSDSINRGTAYRVEFAIKSAFFLSETGELLANNEWKGHRTLAVTRNFYDSIEEQEILDLVFLSTNQVIGLLEDFIHEKLSNQ